MDNLIYGVIGLLIGVYIMYTQLRITLLNKKIEAVQDSFPTTTDIAKEILNIKIPIDQLPKETIDAIKREEHNKKSSYFG